MNLRTLLWTAATLCSVAVLALAWPLLHFAFLEARGSVNSDVQLYLIVGRGLLNGLTPYVDLYESKPPGMFYLSALSLLITNGEALMAWLAATLMIAMPIGIGVFAWKRGNGEELPWRILLTGTAVIMASLLSLYAEEKSGMLQTEMFGGLIGSLYALHLAWRREREETYGSMAINAVLLCTVVLMKETFLLTTLAAAFLLTRNFKHLVRAFFLPLCAAGILALIITIVTGTFWPYLTIDLPSMMLRAGAGGGSDQPVTLRFLDIRRIYSELLKYSTSPLMGVSLAILWCAQFMPKTPVWHDRIAGLLSGAWALFAMHFAGFITFLLVLTYRGETGLGGYFFWVVCVWIVLGLLIAIPAVRRPLRQMSVLRLLLALMLTNLAVGAGSYTAYQFIAALPAYAALLLAFVIRPPADRRWLLCALVPMLIVAAFLYRPTDAHLQEVNDGIAMNASAQEETAKKFDAMIDACGQQSFFVLGSYALFAFTHHSPVGPLFAPHNFDFFLTEGHPLIEATKKRIASTMPIFIIKQGTEVSPIFSSFILERYSKNVPSCAAPFVPIQDYILFFPQT